MTLAKFCLYVCGGALIATGSSVVTKRHIETRTHVSRPSGPFPGPVQPSMLCPVTPEIVYPVDCPIWGNKVETFPLTSIPEPATLGIMGLGLMLLGLRKWM